MEKVTIYGLVDPRNGLLFYVGSTNNLEHRTREHFLGRRGNPGVCRIVNELQALGMKPKLRIFQQCHRDERNAAERKWIIRCHKDGHPLENSALLKVQGLPRVGFDLPPDNFVQIGVLVTKEQAQGIELICDHWRATKSRVVRDLLAYALENFPKLVENS